MASSKLAIIAHTHLGHCPDLASNDYIRQAPDCYGLNAQVQALLEIFDAIRATFGPDTKTLLTGHSMGSWLALQVLKSRREAAASAFLLFPTISHIADTPNGRSFSVWLCFTHTMLFLINVMVLCPVVIPVALPSHICFCVQAHHPLTTSFYSCPVVSVLAC